MPQPNASEVQAKLRARYGNKAGSTRTGGGKNAMRRKKFRQKKSTNEFEKRLQANLKKLSCNTIPGIEEVNLFKSDGTVIHFVSPKVDAEVSSNTFIVSGNYTHNKIEELLPDILPQIGSDHLTQLKDYAEKFEALKPNNDDDNNDSGLPGSGIAGDDGDVPMLIDEDLNFEAVAQSDEKKKDEDETDQTEEPPQEDIKAEPQEADDDQDDEEDDNKDKNEEDKPKETTTEESTAATTTTTTDDAAKPTEDDSTAATEDDKAKPSQETEAATATETETSNTETAQTTSQE